MAGTISDYGGRQQIWNLGNNMIDTSKLVDLELQALEMKKSPYTTQRQTLTNEKNVYASMKKEFGSLVQVFKDLYAFKGDEKKTTLSKDGFMTAQADASRYSWNIHDYSRASSRKTSNNYSSTYSPENS